MFVGRGGEVGRDLFGRSKVSSSARASQAAFFACEIWNCEIRQLNLASRTCDTVEVLDSVEAKARFMFGCHSTAELTLYTPIMFRGYSIFM